MENLKKQIVNIFKLNGLALRSNGLKYLQELLEPVDSNEYERWIEKIIEAIQKLPLSSSVIGDEIIKNAAEAVSTSEIDDITTQLQSIDIFEVPKWSYSVERKKFVLSTDNFPSLHGETDDKALLFKNRYTIIYQRTINHELFRQASASSSSESKQYGLVKVEYLLGLSSNQSNVIVLGLLTQLVECEFHLEDDTGIVKVNLSEATFHTGLFTHNCFVLLEGSFEDGVLTARAIGLPPAESPSTTRALVGNVNYFGGRGSTCAKYNRNLVELEESSTEAMIIFIADLWLDKMQVIEKLQVMLRGYSVCPPTAFIFCGNFSSTFLGPSQVTDMQATFGALGDMISGFPELSASKFIFIPGPNDPGLSNIYPRPPLPKSIQAEFRRKVPSCEFASNPCRLLFCTQEIVIFREDIFTKMCRNSVYFPSDSADIACHFARTLVSQAHLIPLPLHTVPVYWGLDHCFALHPTPDLIVVADKGKPFTTEYNSSCILNPGSFMKTNFSFKVYLPSSKSVEDSQITE